MIFREALFRAPSEGTPPVIILRTSEERDRATGGGYAPQRRELERRLRGRYPVYARGAPTSEERVRYATYDECATERGDQAGAGSNAPDNQPTG